MRSTPTKFSMRTRKKWCRFGVCKALETALFSFVLLLEAVVDDEILAKIDCKPA